VSVKPWSAHDHGVKLNVRLTPKSRSDAIEGIELLPDGRAVLKIRVRALPEAGEANAALLRLLAQSLRLPGSSVTLEAGATGRVKIVRLTGEPDELQHRLMALVEM
jgi:uncharacterized protein